MNLCCVPYVLVVHLFLVRQTCSELCDESVLTSRSTCHEFIEGLSLSGEGVECGLTRRPL